MARRTLRTCRWCSQRGAFEHVVGEGRRDSAHLVETSDLLGRQRRVRRRQVGIELLDGARSDDRERALGGNPSNRVLARRNAKLIRNCNKRIENGGALIGVFRLEDVSAETFASARHTLLTILARQHATAERGPGEHAEAERLAA